MNGHSIAALAVENLSHGFGARQALSEVSFAVEPGRFTVLLGPNGAGKTTLVSLVTGLYTARQGDVQVFGHSMRRDPLPALASLGVVFQMPTLDPDLTVRQNLAYHAALHGLSRCEAAARAEAELERLGVGDRLSDKVRTLSGGLRRRVEVARALLHRPKLLIVDEATAGLDPAGRQALLAHVRTLCAEGLSVLWATHMLDEVGAGDQLIVLVQGGLRWIGRAGDFAAESSPEVAGDRSVHQRIERAFLKLTGGPA